MFWKIIIAAVAFLAVCWIGYGIYALIERAREKKNPPKSETLKKADKTFSDYIDKMQKFEKKTYTRKDLEPK